MPTIIVVIGRLMYKINGKYSFFTPQIQEDIYHIAGKFGKFGKSSVICQTKAVQISIYN